MKLLVRSAQILDPGSRWNGKVCDLLIEDGLIRSIHLSSKNSVALKTKGTEVYDAKGQYLSPGWFDMRVNFNDPGYEHKEDIFTGCEAAAEGGFTGVACLPSTNPPVHNKGQ